MLDYTGYSDPPNDNDACNEIYSYYKETKKQRLNVFGLKYEIDYSCLFENDDIIKKTSFKNIIFNNFNLYKKKNKIGSLTLWLMVVKQEIIKEININILKYFLDNNDRNTLHKLVLSEIKGKSKTPNNTPESSPDLGLFSPRTFKKFIIPNNEIINSIIEYISINNI